LESSSKDHERDLRFTFIAEPAALMFTLLVDTGVNPKNAFVIVVIV
jgi:hypothetical protein